MSVAITAGNYASYIFNNLKKRKGVVKMKNHYYENDEGQSVRSDCPECGELNKSSSEECENCGTDLTA